MVFVHCAMHGVRVSESFHIHLEFKHAEMVGRRSERDTQSSSSIPILPSERRKLLLGVKYVCTGVELKMQLRMTLCFAHWLGKRQ